MAFDLDRILEQAYAKHRIPEKLIYELCERAKDILVNESNLRTVHAPVTLVGDIHGLAKLTQTILRFTRDLQDRWKVSRYKLYFFGRLR